MIYSIANRILRFPIILLCASLIIFSLLYCIPGDPVIMIAGEYASPENIENIRRELSLDKSFFVRFYEYTVKLIILDLGRSIHSGVPVIDLIFEKFPATFMLALFSMIIAFLLGAILGTISAIFKESFWDNLVLWFSSIFISTPIFVSCFILSLIFSYFLNLFPPSGMKGFNPSYIILPSLALASRSLALIVRIVRNELITVMNKDYIRTVRSLGFSESRIIFVFAFKNIIIPVLTIVLLDFGAYLGGAVVTESIFSWPGIGRLLIMALYKRDIPLIQGIILFGTFLFLVIGLIIDILQSLVFRNEE